MKSGKKSVVDASKSAFSAVAGNQGPGAKQSWESIVDRSLVERFASSPTWEQIETARSAARQEGFAAGRLAAIGELQKKSKVILDDLASVETNKLRVFLETLGLDLSNRKALQDAAGLATRKNDRVAAKASIVALEALAMADIIKTKMATSQWQAIGEPLVEFGVRVGRIEQMLMRKERNDSQLWEIFSARERWRRDPRSKHRRFDSTCIFDYGSTELRDLTKKGLQNLIARFKRSVWHGRSMLLATGFPDDSFYDSRRGRKSAVGWSRT